MQINKEIGKNKKTTLTITAYTKIKEAIITHELAPGEVLSENTLADYLKMSRTPIREALKMLQRDDLIEIMPGSGTLVKTVTEKELRDLYSVRIALECLAVETAINYISDNEIDDKIKEWETLKADFSKDHLTDWELISAADNDLHKMLIVKSHNVFLNYVYDILKNKIIRYQMLSVYSLGDITNTISQHIELLLLIKEKNIERITSSLKQHLMMSMEYIIRKI